MPAAELGAVQARILELEQRLHEIFSNQEIIEQRLIPVTVPYPSGGAQPESVKEQPKCQIEDAISGACALLTAFAQRQRMTLQHLQV
jgi:hypothetical protein